MVGRMHDARDRGPCHAPYAGTPGLGYATSGAGMGNDRSSRAGAKNSGSWGVPRGLPRRREQAFW